MEKGEVGTHIFDIIPSNPPTISSSLLTANQMPIFSEFILSKSPNSSIIADVELKSTPIGDKPC